MTNSSGNEVNSYDSDLYGQNINQVEQSGLNNPWKFAAGYLDSATTLYKFGTRYYDSSLGRWTQQDPVGGSLGDLNSANRYVYANDDPVNLVDPSGRFSLDAFFTCLTGGINAFTRAIIGTGVLAGIGAAIAVGLSAGSLAAVFAGITAGLGAFLIGYCLGYAIWG